MVTGDAQITLSIAFRISPPTVGRIIKETCQVIWNVLSERLYLSVPSTKKEWLNIAAGFHSQWNYPHCLGAIDGKHVMIQAPARSGSAFFNYKKTFSVVLLAVCNAKYEFTLYDIGEAGRQSDGGVYSSSNLGYAIENKLLNFPNPKPIPSFDTTKSFPYVFVADEAFGMKPHMMRPYPRRNDLNLPERIFNYRLSRARRVIENTFGILASRFRIFRRPIIANVRNVRFITKAAVGLHNFLISKNTTNGANIYCRSDYIDHENEEEEVPGQWREEIGNYEGLIPIRNQGSNNFTRMAKEVRDLFKDYFNSVGAVSWQNNIVNRTTDPFDEDI